MRISNNKINITRVKLSAAHLEAVAKKRLWHDPINPTIIGYADTRGKLIPGTIWSGGQHQTPLAQQHYDSTAGKWLHPAATIEFKKPIAPLAWVLKNKPKDEQHSLSFLILAISCVNAHVREKIQVFEIPVSAYNYLRNNTEARKELHKVYESLLKAKTAPADINYVKIKMTLNKAPFINQKNKNVAVSDGYLKAMVKVYLHFVLEFQNMDNPKLQVVPEEIVRKWYEAGNDGNIK